MKLDQVKSIKDTQNFLHALYPNSKLDADYIFGYLSRSVAYLAKNISYGTETQDMFVESYAWCIALASKFDIDLQEAMIARYPNCCHYCLVKPCVCYKTNKQPSDENIPSWRIKDELDAKSRQMSNQYELLSLDFMVNLINEIYSFNGAVWNSGGKPKHLLKLQEEIGEIHEAYSGFMRGRKEKRDVQNELADALGWLFGAWANIGCQCYMDAFKNYYSKGCPVCLKEKCLCKPRSGRPKELLDNNKLKSLVSDLSDLADTNPDYKEEIAELSLGLNEALNSGDESIKKQAITETKSRLSKILERLTSLGKFSESSNEIIVLVKELAGLIK